MSQQDDRPEDAATEWLSPALYRQLCDAVDAALFAPPDARDGILAARLGSDQRLLAEARALLASHESSPRTFITPAPTGGGDETYVGQSESATMIRRESATVIVPGSGTRRAYQPPSGETDGTQEMRALPGAADTGSGASEGSGWGAAPGEPGSGSGPGSGQDSGTVTLRAPLPEPSPTADTTPRIPIAQDGPASAGTRPAGRGGGQHARVPVRWHGSRRLVGVLVRAG